MSQLDATRLVEAVRRRLTDFALDRSFVRDERLAAVCRELWSGPAASGGLVNELWVEGAFPAERALHTLADLAAAGLFDPALCRHLAEVGAVPEDRSLYAHQEAAIRAARDGGEGNRPALVVTAGTGAGKTESFLLPILDDLYSRPRTAGEEGVRCLILYPMNALVNDQVERLDAWLAGQDRLTLFHFTSETPEDHKKRAKQGMPEGGPHRIMTRRQARRLETDKGRKLDPAERGPVPDVLVTNYSMLEYMLCRPQDGVLFGSALRAVVLDEAHLYAGTLAAEIMLLLRRVLDRCGRASGDVLQIATSATLGGSPDDLAKFASAVFTKPAARVITIRGERARPELGDPTPPTVEPTPEAVNGRTWLNGRTIGADAEGRQRLVAFEPGAASQLRADLAILTDPAAVAGEPGREDVRPARILWAALRHAPIVARMEDELFRAGRLSVGDLADRLWGGKGADAEQATLTLLKLVGAARDAAGDEITGPLLGHRLHVLVRSASGIAVCLNPDCTGPADHRWQGFGCLTAESREACSYCGKALLAVCRCDNCGGTAVAGQPWRPSCGKAGTPVRRPGGSGTNDRVRTASSCGRPTTRRAMFSTSTPTASRAGTERPASACGSSTAARSAARTPRRGSR